MAVLFGAVAKAAPPEVQKNGLAYAKGQAGVGTGLREGAPALPQRCVMTTGAAVKAIFWGTSWRPSPGDKVAGIDTFYGGRRRHAVPATNIEYTDVGRRITSPLP